MRTQVLNSVKARSRHQLHIHVAPMSSGFSSCLSSLNLPKSGTWAQPANCFIVSVHPGLQGWRCRG